MTEQTVTTANDEGSGLPHGPKSSRREFLKVTVRTGAGLFWLAIADACSRLIPQTTPTPAPSTTPSPPPVATAAEQATHIALSPAPSATAVEPTVGASPSPAPSATVTKETILQGAGLTINKERGEFESNGKRLRCVGFNRYDILTMSPQDQNTIFESAAAMGGKILRFWCPASLTNGGNETAKIKSLVKLAEKNRMYLYPVFIDHWGTYNNQKKLGSDWYQSGYKTDGYRDYVKKVTTAFRGVPQIGIWELVNEPETANAGDLKAFAKDINDLIQSIDPGKPVSLGTIGTGQPGAQQQDWLTDMEAVSVASMHDDKNTTVSTDFGGQDNNFQTRLPQAKQNKLPFVIGELGIDADCKGGDPCLNPQDRATVVAAKLSTYFNAGVDMVLGWSVGLNEFGYDITPSDPVAAVWKHYAQQLQN